MDEKETIDVNRTTIGDQICMGAIFILFIAMGAWLVVQVVVWGAA